MSQFQAFLTDNNGGQLVEFTDKHAVVPCEENSQYLSNMEQKSKDFSTVLKAFENTFSEYVNLFFIIY